MKGGGKYHFIFCSLILGLFFAFNPEKKFSLFQRWIMERMEAFFQDIRVEKFANGLKFIYKYFPGEIVGVSIFIDSGSADEAEYIGSGIAHLTEHLVFEGRKDLEEKLRKLGAISNAYTTLDHTLYHLEVPKKNYKKALELFVPAIFKPSISEEIFKREREVVLKEEKFRDDNPASLLMKIGFEKSYINHPYKYPVLGEPDLLNSLTFADLQRFHNLRYLPNNAVISIAGELDYQEVKQFLSALVSDFIPAPVSKRNFPRERKNFYTEYTQVYPGDLVYIFISFPGISMFDEDLEALDLLADYLSWGKDSPLYKRFVEKGICYSISFLNYTPYSQGLLGLTAVLEENNIGLFQQEIEKFLQEIKKGRFDGSRLQRLKKRTAFEFLKAQESPLTISQFLSRDEGLSGNYKFSLIYLEKILKLNPETLRKVARKYLDLNFSTRVQLLPRGREEIKFPRKKIQRNYSKVEYPNGLRLILAQSEVSPLTAITVLFQGGLRTENLRINGISQILPRVLITAELQRKFEELGGKIRPISGNNSLGLEVEVIQDNLKDALKLISQIVIRPEFDFKELEIQKNIQLGKIKDSEIDLFYQAFKLLRESIYERHPYKMMPEGNPDSVSNLKLEDLKSFSSKIFIPNNCVLSIAGDIDLKRVEEEVKELFSNWQRQKIQIAPELDPYPHSKRFASKKIPQREVVIEIGFMVPEITSPARYYLDLIQTLVSGQGSLFFNKIRREIGAAYTLGGGLFLGPDPGVISFYVATIPELKEQVLEKMSEIIKEFSSGNISEEEIQDAKEILKTRFYRDTITNASLSFFLGIEETVGRGYQEVERYLNEIERLNKEELSTFVGKYLDPEKAVVVEVGNI